MHQSSLFPWTKTLRWWLCSFMSRYLYMSNRAMCSTSDICWSFFSPLLCTSQILTLTRSIFLNHDYHRPTNFLSNCSIWFLFVGSSPRLFIREGVPGTLSSFRTNPTPKCTFASLSVDRMILDKPETKGLGEKCEPKTKWWVYFRSVCRPYNATSSTLNHSLLYRL